MSDPQRNIISEEMILKLKVILEKQHDREFAIEDVREIAYELVSFYELIRGLKS
jgi:hypothetical protein